MPYDDPDPDDPSMLMGVTLPGTPEATREMADAFADEFAALGLDREAILALFRAPEYVAAHGAWKSLGDAEIGRIVDESLGFWGRVRFVISDADTANTTSGQLVGPDGRLRMLS